MHTTYGDAYRLLQAQVIPSSVSRFCETLSDNIAAIAILKISAQSAQDYALISPTLSILKGIPITYVAGFGVAFGNAIKTDDSAKMGSLLRLGVWLSFLMAAGTSMIGIFATAVFLKGIGQPHEAADAAEHFMRFYAIGAFPTLFMRVLQQYSLASGYAKWNPVFTGIERVTFLALTLSLVLTQAYSLASSTILGFSYAASSCLSTLSFFIFLAARGMASKHQWFKKELGLRHFREVHQMSWPMALHMSSEFGIRLYLTALIGKLNPENLILTQPAFLCESLLSNISAALSQGISIVISEEKNPEQARKIGNLALLAIFCLMAVMLAITPAFASLLARYLLPDFEENTASIHTAVKWMFFMFALQIPEGLRSVSAGALQGLKPRLGHLMNELPIFLDIFTDIIITFPIAFGLSHIKNIEVAGIFIALLSSVSVIAMINNLLWYKASHIEENVALNWRSLKKLFWKNEHRMSYTAIASPRTPAEVIDTTALDAENQSDTPTKETAPLLKP